MSAENSVAESDILAGEDALVGTADLLYQTIRTDPRFEEYFEEVDLAKLASQLRRLLGHAFEGEEWPEVHVGMHMIEECFEDFASVLLEAMQRPIQLGEDLLITSLEHIQEEMAEDERLLRFFDHITAAAALPEEEEEEEHNSVPAGDGFPEGPAPEGLDDQQDQHGTTTGNEINTTSFEELVLDPTTVQAANDAWRTLILTAESREAAGEAIYAALFEGAPSLQSLFTTPRAVQAMRFMTGLGNFVQSLDNPAQLKSLVETLSFGHLHLDVTVPRVIIFRDALLDLFVVELEDKFTPIARDGWIKLLNYVGGAIIYVKANYADRIVTLLRSWKLANHVDSNKDKQLGSDSASGVKATHQRNGGGGNSGKGWMKYFKGSSAKNAPKEGEEHNYDAKETTALREAGNQVGGQQVPTTYPEMFAFNAAVMGFGTATWMTEVLGCFDNIVLNVANSARLQEECDVLALRIAKQMKGPINLAEYKSCMLASLRSLLPKDWDSAHEVAWTWLWENVERLILRVHGQPPVWEKALSKLLGSWDETQKFEVRKEIYARFFDTAPAGQDYFKQSNTYLHFIAEKVLCMSLELYQDPIKMVDDISALGLRHVGYGIPTELFGPFVTACVDVVMTQTSDETTVESFRWALGLVSKILVRTINEGSTIVMRAINQNSQKLLKKAISCAPRGERAKWMLIVQVGTHSISPLAWAIESGNLEAATAMIKDLLTLRADRDRYYYGVDELFERHPDIIRMMCENAPLILPKLLDGLIWRSRLTDKGTRRVNYFVKHLIVDEENDFSKSLGWIAHTKDPKLVCHPVVALISDIIWSRVAYRTFLYGKSWFFFTLLIFIVSQSIVEHWHEEEEKGDVERILVFACRCFIYACSMVQLIFSHCRDTFHAYRTKETFRLLCVPVPKYLKQWQDMASFSLTVSLIVMLCIEPILRCWKHQHGKIFNEACEENEDLRFLYTLFSMFSMFLYYTLLIDLTVVSTRISAFVLVCVRMMSEVALFLGALAGAILTFSSAISVLHQSNHDFAGIHRGSKSLFRIVMGAFSPARFTAMEDEPTVLAVVFVFMVATIIFLMNLLIAQLSCAYSSVYEDMIGYARLERADIIVEIMPSVPKWRFSKFVDSLRFNKRLEFNEGDVGLSGGIQVKEPASANPTTIDMIRRFGGSTSPEMQWPEDDVGDCDENDRFDRIEKLIQKTLQRVTKKGNGGHYSGQGKGGSSQLSGLGGSGKDTSSNDSMGSHASQ